MIGSPPSIRHFAIANEFIIFIGTSNEKSFIVVRMWNFHPPSVAFSTFVKRNFVPGAIEFVSENQEVRVVGFRVIVISGGDTINKVPDHLGKQLM